MKVRFFELARQLSYKSDYESQKLGCVIVKKNKIISVGFNQRKTHPKSNTRFNHIHAELSAVLGVDKELLRNSAAYVYRETKDGKAAMAKPCPACEDVLKRVGIKKVYYSSIDGFKEEYIGN